MIVTQLTETQILKWMAENPWGRIVINFYDDENETIVKQETITFVDLNEFNYVIETRTLVYGRLVITDNRLVFQWAEMEKMLTENEVEFFTR